MLQTSILRLLRRLLGRRGAICYIGGSDILPPPLDPQEEQEALLALERGDLAARNRLI